MSQANQPHPTPEQLRRTPERIRADSILVAQWYPHMRPSAVILAEDYIKQAEIFLKKGQFHAARGWADRAMMMSDLRPV